MCLGDGSIRYTRISVGGYPHIVAVQSGYVNRTPIQRTREPPLAKNLYPRGHTRASQSRCLWLNRLRLPRKRPLRPSGLAAPSPAARVGATDLQLEMTATSMCRTLTPGNSGKICRSLRSQQELPEQELMRVRFACFGLSVLLGTNSFPFPKPQTKAPQIHRILRRQVGQPSPKPADNHHMLRASREEWHQWASVENANGQRLCRESQKQTN